MFQRAGDERLPLRALDQSRFALSFCPLPLKVILAGRILVRLDFCEALALETDCSGFAFARLADSLPSQVSPSSSRNTTLASMLLLAPPHPRCWPPFPSSHLINGVGKLALGFRHQHFIQPLFFPPKRTNPLGFNETATTARAGTARSRMTTRVRRLVRCILVDREGGFAKGDSQVAGYAWRVRRRWILAALHAFSNPVSGFINVRRSHVAGSPLPRNDLRVFFVGAAGISRASNVLRARLQSAGNGEQDSAAALARSPPTPPFPANAGKWKPACPLRDRVSAREAIDCSRLLDHHLLSQQRTAPKPRPHLDPLSTHPNLRGTHVPPRLGVQIRPRSLLQIFLRSQIPLAQQLP